MFGLMNERYGRRKQIGPNPPEASDTAGEQNGPRDQNRIHTNPGEACRKKPVMGKPQSTANALKLVAQRVRSAARNTRVHFPLERRPQPRLRSRAGERILLVWKKRCLRSQATPLNVVLDRRNSKADPLDGTRPGIIPRGTPFGTFFSEVGM